MFVTVCLISGALTTAQLPDRSQPPLPVTPRPALAAQTPGVEKMLRPALSTAQELVYRGSFEEKAGGGQVRFDRTYQFEGRVFVVEAALRGTEVALLTLFRDTSSARKPRGADRPEPAARSARL